MTGVNTVYSRCLVSGVGFLELCTAGKKPQQEAESKVEHEQLVHGQFNHGQLSLSFLDVPPPVFVCVGVFMCLNVYARAAQTDEYERTVLSSSPVLTVLLIPSTCSNTHPKNTSLPLFHVPVSGVPGARLCLCLRLHTSYRPWPGSAPPTPSRATYINRRKNK